MLSQDLSVLKTEADIFVRAKEYGPISEQEKLVIGTFAGPTPRRFGIPARTGINQRIERFQKGGICVHQRFASTSGLALAEGYAPLM